MLYYASNDDRAITMAITDYWEVIGFLLGGAVAGPSYICVYIYIYIERERDICISMYTYVYIYIYT